MRTSLEVLISFDLIKTTSTNDSECDLQQVQVIVSVRLILRENQRISMRTSLEVLSFVDHIITTSDVIVSV